MGDDRVIDDSPDWWDEYDTCHPACKCREARVKRLVEAAEITRETLEFLQKAGRVKVGNAAICAALVSIKAAIEGVTARAGEG